MAKFTTAAGIEDLTGKLSTKDRIVMRQKTYRLSDGTIIKCGPKEAFARDTRDYKRSPRTEAEVAQNNKWKAACQETSRIIHDVDHPRYAELWGRWIRHAKGQPDPLLGKRIVAQFDIFVRLIIHQELQNENNP